MSGFEWRERIRGQRWEAERHAGGLKLRGWVVPWANGRWHWEARILDGPVLKLARGGWVDSREAAQASAERELTVAAPK